MVSQPGRQFLPRFRLVEGEHGLIMTDTGQLIDSLVPDMNGRGTRHHIAGLFFQGAEFIVQPIIFQIGHDLRISGIVGLGSSV